MNDSSKVHRPSLIIILAKFTERGIVFFALNVAIACSVGLTTKAPSNRRTQTLSFFLALSEKMLFDFRPVLVHG